MPRVATKKKQYNAADFCAWIYAKLKVSRRTLGELADVIGCTRKTLYNKMSSQKADFDYQELMEIFKFCNASDEEILRFMRIWKRKWLLVRIAAWSPWESPFFASSRKTHERKKAN